MFMYGDIRAAIYFYFILLCVSNILVHFFDVYLFGLMEVVVLYI